MVAAAAGKGRSLEQMLQILQRRPPPRPGFETSLHMRLHDRFWMLSCRWGQPALLLRKKKGSGLTVRA